MILINLSFGIASALLIGGYIWIARRSGWLDAPNHRSSHTQATPRGAGIVVAMLTASAALFYLRNDPNLVISLLLGLVVATVGWCDDIRGLSARTRFVVYGGCASAVVLVMYNGESGLPHPLLQAAAVLAGAIGLLWLINLYNFMDGINGIAAFEALFVLCAALWLPTDWTSSMRDFIVASLFMIGGFLLWNFPAAKIFMGDAGSAFLGFFFGVLMLLSSGPALTTWLLLLGVFIVDASYTLAVRVVTGQKWHQAHRTHAYQRLNQLLNSHPKTVVIFMGVNVVWLLPWAWALQHNWLLAPAALFGAYLPLVAACYALKAGIPLKAGV